MLDVNMVDVFLFFDLFLLISCKLDYIVMFFHDVGTNHISYSNNDYTNWFELHPLPNYFLLECRVFYKNLC